MSRQAGVKRHARSIGSIDNMEHHDPSASKRTADGTPGLIDEVVADSTELTSLYSNQTVRVANLTGATQYVWVGAWKEAPATPDATNSFAIPAGHVELFHPSSFKTDSPAVKTSSISVQVVKLES